MLWKPLSRSWPSAILKPEPCRSLPEDAAPILAVPRYGISPKEVPVTEPPLTNQPTPV